MADTSKMTDIEFVKHWIDECTEFIHPALFKELRERGLYYAVNLIHGNTKDERKANAIARMVQRGHYSGEPEIEKIAGAIAQVHKLKADLYNTADTEPLAQLEIMDKLKHHLEYVRDYFKPIPVL